MISSYYISFNPTFTGLRSLQQASPIEYKKLGIKQTSLGSLSEASNVFDPELRRPIIMGLAQEARPLKLEKRLNNFNMSLVTVDGTLLKALPKILWALWLNNDHPEVKMHLEFNILKSLPYGRSLLMQIETKEQILHLI